MAVQKKQSVVPPSQGPLSTRTIESQRKGNGYERTGDYFQPNSQAKKMACPIIKFAQICNTGVPRINPASNGNNIDERLKAARERREEHEKSLASRELGRREREQRARQYYQQQLQQRKKKLLEHRLKEEQRRAAVEEKRKQRLKEEKERHESAVRRTQEKSQKATQNTGQNIRGRKLTKNVPRRLPLTPWEKNLVSRLLTPTCSYLARSKSAGCQSGEEVSFHSMNTTISTITPQKPQRSSSVPSRPSVSPSPNYTQYRSINLVQMKSPRQQEAPKKISNSVSNTRSVSLSPNNSNLRKITMTQITSPRQQDTPKKNSYSVSNTRSASSSPKQSQQRNISLVQMKSPRQQDAPKRNSNSVSNTRSPAVNNRAKPPAVTKSRVSPPPSPDRSPRRSLSRHSTPLQLELPSVPEEDVSVCSSALAPGNSRPVRTSAEGQEDEMRNNYPPETPCSNLPDNMTATARTRAARDESPPQLPAPSAPQPSQVMPRLSAGTSDPDEALRLMAERRREARLQREREEQERLQKEEEERRCREELERRRAEERARQQAEAQRLIEEKRRREEEEQRQAEEERAQAMREAALLQKQREEEQAKEREKAEQIKQEREILAQKEEAARQARKKRLEEIMRRTRRTDSPDTKSAPVRTTPNEAQPKENTQPVHNGTIEDAVKLPVVTKTSQLGLSNEEDMVPVVAFKERRSLRTLTGLEEIQTHQRAEVI